MITKDDHTLRRYDRLIFLFKNLLVFEKHLIDRYVEGPF